MKRLLWLTENYPPQRGGMAQSCDRIVHGLRQEGFVIDVVHFVASDRATPTKELLQGSYTSIGNGPSESFVLNRAWLQLRKLPPPDYLVCFGGLLPMTGAPIFSKWLNTPLVTLIRGNDFDESLFAPRKRKLLEDCLNQSTLICTVSAEKQWKIQQLSPDHKVLFIANGIDANAWKASTHELEFAEQFRSKIPSNKIVLGLFGDLKAKKGVPFLLEALRKNRWANALHLLLIGEMQETIETLLTKHQITYDRLPFQDRFQLLKYYLCCDAMAIPSFYDGMPNVLLEAGALRVPVIGSKVDGMIDVIEAVSPECLFEADSEDGCRKAIYSIIQRSEKERKQLGLRLQQHIQQNFTHRHEIEKYSQIFS